MNATKEQKGVYVRPLDERDNMLLDKFYKDSHFGVTAAKNIMQAAHSYYDLKEENLKLKTKYSDLNNQYLELVDLIKDTIIARKVVEEKETVLVDLIKSSEKGANKKTGPVNYEWENHESTLID